MFVLVNLKAYDTDPEAVAEAAAVVDRTTDVRVGVAPQTATLGLLAETDAELWAQHISPVEHGSHTGSTLPEAVAETGATGTLLNHSERRVTLDHIDTAIRSAARAGLETVVCANTPNQIAAVTALGPDAVAVEPPELIGSGVPVSRADPDVVRDAVNAAERVDPSVSVLCGAGISEADDVIAAEELGAEGVLLASGIAKAEDPAAALRELVAPYE